MTPKWGKPRRRRCEAWQTEKHRSQAVLHWKPPSAPIVHLFQGLHADNPALIERSKEDNHVLRVRYDAPVRPIRRTHPSACDVDIAVKYVGRLVEPAPRCARVTDQPRVFKPQRIKNAGLKGGAAAVQIGTAYLSTPQSTISARNRRWLRPIRSSPARRRFRGLSPPPRPSRPPDESPPTSSVSREKALCCLTFSLSSCLSPGYSACRRRSSRCCRSTGRPASAAPRRWPRRCAA